MNMAMTESDGKTTVSVVTDADILGKIGQYGHGMISKRADSMFADFTSCVKTQLERAVMADGRPSMRSKPRC